MTKHSNGIQETAEIAIVQHAAGAAIQITVERGHSGKGPVGKQVEIMPLTTADAIALGRALIATAQQTSQSED